MTDTIYGIEKENPDYSTWETHDEVLLKWKHLISKKVVNQDRIKYQKIDGKEGMRVIYGQYLVVDNDAINSIVEEHKLFRIEFPHQKLCSDEIIQELNMPTIDSIF